MSASYKASGIIPGYANRAQMSGVTFAADMAQLNMVGLTIAPC